MVSDKSADRAGTTLALCQSDLPRAVFFETYLTLPAIKGILSFWSIWEAAGSEGRDGLLHGQHEAVGISCSQGAEGASSPQGYPGSWNESKVVFASVNFLCLSVFSGH